MDKDQKITLSPVSVPFELKKHLAKGKRSPAEIGKTGWQMDQHCTSL